jgi:hypothetical protein
MNLNLGNVMYLGFRMGPFILVCVFLLQSMLNLDIRGMIYLSGLLLTCFLVLMVDRATRTAFGDFVDGESPNPKCNVITLGDGGGMLSYIPLSMTTYAFTFFYLIIFVLNLGSSKSTGIIDAKSVSAANTNAAIQRHYFIFVLFPILILAEWFWLSGNQCVPNALPRILSAIVLGGGVGVAWAMMVTSIGKPELQMFSTSNNDVCSQPSKQKFRCKVVTKV